MPTLAERLQAALPSKYRVEAEVAAGGMGVVYLARDLALDRRVAVKVLLPELASAAAVARFRREARILARFSHPSIVPIHEVGPGDDTADGDALFYFVMDYVEGDTLARLLERGPLREMAVVALGRQLLEALDLAHREGIIHRDVKPSNIFVVGERALLADFGVAQWADDREMIVTLPGHQPGTLGYMAPEQIGGGPVTPRTDLYALAAVLYEAATGRHWRLGTPPARADWSGVGRVLGGALRRALAAEPEGRWPSAAAFHAALARPRRIMHPLGVAALIIVATGFWLGGRSGAATTRVEQGADLMLLPFDQGDSAGLGLRLARYTALGLEWYPRWTLVPTRRTLGVGLAPEPDESGDAQAAGALFEARGAIVVRPDSRRLVVTVDSGGRLHGVFEIPDPGEILQWSRAVADTLVAHVFPASLEEYRELTARSSPNVQAQRELLAGNDAFQVGNIREAGARYVRALRLDPSFAQADWQLMLARRWERTEDEPGLRRLHDRHAANLPPLYRSLTVAQLEPDLRDRARALAAIGDSFPARGAVRFIRADELFHRGALVGIPLREAVDSLVAGARDDPFLDQASTYDHAAWGNIRLGDEEGARAQFARRRARTRGHAARESEMRGQFMRLAADARFHPWRAAAKRWALLRFADSTSLAELSRYVRLGLVFDIPEMQLHLGEAVARKATTPAARMQGEIAQGLAQLMRGRIDAGLAHLDVAGAARPSAEMQLQRAEWRLMPQRLGMPARPADERARARAELVAAAAASPFRARAAWDLAALSIHDGDTSAASHWDSVLHLVAGDDRGAARLDLLLHASLAAARGQPDSALLITDPLFMTDSTGRLGGPFARTVLYLSRAAWLDRLGRHADADRARLWYENSDLLGWPAGEPQAGEVDAVFGVIARVVRGRSALARGDTATGCVHLRRVSELWRHADPAVRSLLEPFSGVPCLH